MGELPGEFFADAGRGAGDEDGFVLEEGGEVGHGEMIIENGKGQMEKRKRWWFHRIGLGIVGSHGPSAAWSVAPRNRGKE